MTFDLSAYVADREHVRARMATARELARGTSDAVLVAALAYKIEGCDATTTALSAIGMLAEFRLLITSGDDR